MGPDRHRRLINWLSMVVALQLAVALVAVATRAGREIDGGRAVSAEQAQNGSILAGAKIEKRKGGQDTRQAARQPSSTTAPTAPPTTATPATAAPVVPAVPVAPPTDLTTSTRQERSRESTAAPARPTTTTTTPAPAAAKAQVQHKTMTDPAGDTVADASGEALTEARADIVKGGVAYGPEGLTFALGVSQPVDPRTDERWAADSTYAQWDVDTNGDNAPDFEVQYYVIDGAELGGSVSKAGEGGETVCDMFEAGYSDGLYWIVVDPACLGNPASVTMRATLFYDTNPADENATVATDLAPNGGWSHPVARPS